MTYLKSLFGIALATTVISITVNAGLGDFRAVCEEPRLALIGTCNDTVYDSNNDGKKDIKASLSYCFFEDGLWFYNQNNISCDEGEVYPSQAWDLIKSRNLEGSITSFAFRSENPELVDFNYGNRPTKKYTDFSKVPFQFKK